MLVGVFLILLGSLMLLDRMGLIDIHVGDYIIPIVFIAIGASMVVKNQNRSAAAPPGSTRK